MENDQYHVADYSKVCNTGAVGLVSRFVHRSLESFGIVVRRNRILRRSDLLKILEVGAGGGQHARYVRHSFERLIECDIRPENIPNVADDPRIVKEFKPVDAQNLPYADNSHDRLIATCLLAHLSDPEKALEEWKRIVRPGGVISIFVPCEPGFLLRISQMMTTRRKQKILGYNGRLLHYREHRNHHPGMMTFIRQIYGSDARVTNYPFPFLSWNFNLWSIVQVESLTKSEKIITQ